MSELIKSARRTLARRRFLADLGRGTLAAALSLFGYRLYRRRDNVATVWQINPFKCIQCGRCATHCVLDMSAVKCVHDYPMCGYCDLCTGFFQPNPIELNTGAENQLCPIDAIKRHFVEDPYFEYDIDETRCFGCAKCVQGCTQFGNGSLYLQVKSELCVGCNECRIAANCPANAFVKRPVDDPYIVKHLGPEAAEESSLIA